MGTEKLVLWVDVDLQGSLTVSLGVKTPDDLPISIATVMQGVIKDRTVPENGVIIRHEESIDLLQSSIDFIGLEVSLFNTMGRGFVLKNAMEPLKRNITIS